MSWFLRCVVTGALLQVCSFRSSFYSDVLQHFASFHRESCFLLCVFCLKVTRNPVSYQQHLLRHQVTPP